MATVIVPQNPEPFAFEGFEPEQPYVAAYDLEMARQTLALAYRANQTRKSWTWTEGEAPTVKLAAADTWTSAQYYDTAAPEAATHIWQVLWRMNQFALGVEGVLMFLCGAQMPVAWRLQKLTTAAGSSEDGPATPHAMQLSGMPLQRGHQRRNASVYGYSKLMAVPIALPAVASIPGSRMIQLRLQAKWDAGNLPGTGTQSYDVFAVGLYLRDVMVKAGE